MDQDLVWNLTIDLSWLSDIHPIIIVGSAWLIMCFVQFPIVAKVAYWDEVRSAKQRGYINKNKNGGWGSASQNIPAVQDANGDVSDAVKDAAYSRAIETAEQGTHLNLSLWFE